MFLRKAANYCISLILILVILCGSFAGKAWAMTIEEEKKLGKTIFLEMERGVEFVKDPALQAFLERMGQSLISPMGVTPFEFNSI
jgi:predicted Zn-dependent protease